MKYHVFIPSVEYRDFIIERLNKICEINHIMYSPNIYPYHMVIEIYDDGSIHTGWNVVDCNANKRVDFSEIEQIIKDHNVIEWCSKKVLFDDDGTIHMGEYQHRMDFDKLEEIYMRAKDKRENNEN